MTEAFKVARWGAICAIAAGLLVAAVHALNVWGADGDIAAFDARSDTSVFEWVARAAIAASLAAVVALGFWARRNLALLTAIAAFLTLALVDDTLGVHRELGAAWDLAYLVLLVGGGLLLWRLRADPPEAGRAIRIGVVVLAVSLFAHAGATRVVNRLEWGPGHAGYETKVLVKEAAEVTGWMLVSAGLTAYALAARRRFSGG